MYSRRRMVASFAGSVMIVLSLATPRQAHAGPPPAPRDIALVNTITWGANQSTITAFRSVGQERWLQSQLHPAPADHLPKAAQQQIDALAVSKRSALELATDFNSVAHVANERADPDQRAAAQNILQNDMTDIAKQAATASNLRALYSPDQLQERMMWFWFNHFNVHQYKANLRVLVGDYERNAIRSTRLAIFAIC
jgi:hypothetical protein